VRCLIDSAKDIADIAPGYYIGGALMIIGGIIAIFLGVHAEGESLENIAKPLTAEDNLDESGPSDDSRQPAPA